jgi:hypothetical protein
MISYLKIKLVAPLDLTILPTKIYIGIHTNSPPVIILPT